MALSAEFKEKATGAGVVVLILTLFLAWQLAHDTGERNHPTATPGGIGNAGENTDPGDDGVASSGFSQTGGGDGEREGGVLYENNIFGYAAMCARMNTPDWGYGQHYDATEPEVRSFSQMRQAFIESGIWGGDKVVLIQGTEVSVLATSDPKLLSMANKSEVCVPLTSQP